MYGLALYGKVVKEKHISLKAKRFMILWRLYFSITERFFNLRRNFLAIIGRQQLSVSSDHRLEHHGSYRSTNRGKLV